jgi:AbrB family looped-hinge helix DNA binding protein
VIPKEIRAALKLKPGQDLKLISINGMVTLIPVRPISQYRGLLKGCRIDYPADVREKKDREL